jgi:hypothetical protein
MVAQVPKEENGHGVGKNEIAGRRFTSVFLSFNIPIFMVSFRIFSRSHSFVFRSMIFHVR